MEDDSSEIRKEYLQLLSFISHDLRAPTRTIRSFAELLTKELDQNASEKTREFLKFIGENALTMESYLDTILFYSRLHHRPPVSSEVMPHILIKNIWETSKSTVHDDEIKIEELPSVQADENLMFELFSQLIRNSLTFRASDQPLRVEIRSHIKPGELNIQIQDNGRGIPEDMKNRVFGLFETCHTEKHHKGCGMGLAIARRIAKMHQGDLYWDQTDVVGTTFILKLPYSS